MNQVCYAKMNAFIKILMERKYAKLDVIIFISIKILILLNV